MRDEIIIRFARRLIFNILIGDVDNSVSDINCIIL